MIKLLYKLLVFREIIYDRLFDHPSYSEQTFYFIERHFSIAILYFSLFAYLYLLICLMPLRLRFTYNFEFLC